MDEKIVKLISIFMLLTVANFIANLFGSSQARGSEASSEYTLIAGNKVYLRNGGNFVGDPQNPDDDALIYAHHGFTIDSLAETILPTQKDTAGNTLRTDNNLEILVDHALAVSSTTPEINVPELFYDGLTTPPRVVAESVNIPSYLDLQRTEIEGRQQRDDSTVAALVFDARLNPLNSAQDWLELFPDSGLVDQVTVVNVLGGITIPDGANLANYIIKVDGTLKFNGTSTLENVVLIVNSGGVDFGNAQFHDSAIFAPGMIKMNPSARFSGKSLIASLADISFDGATVTTEEIDELTIATQGSIYYNAAQDSRSSLFSGANVNFIGRASLTGKIVAQNDIHCFSFCTIVGVPNHSSGLANPNEHYAD